MFRKFALILMALLLAALPALAEAAPPYFNKGSTEDALVFSEDVLLMQTANSALIDRYGLTRATLGLFQQELSRCGETAIVTYASSGSIPDSLAGQYFVIITGDSVQPLWTHDAVDPALWQSGELTSPAWGVKQLTAYLDAHPYERADFCTPYVREFSSFDWDPLLAAGGSFQDVCTENRAEAGAARDLAIAAVKAMYGLSDEETAKLSWLIDMCRLYHYPDGHGEWEIMLQDDDVLDPISYYVTLDEDTGLILKVILSSGGVG